MTAVQVLAGPTRRLMRPALELCTCLRRQTVHTAATEQATVTSLKAKKRSLFAYERPDRVYPLRKRLLFSHYRTLLETNQVVIFLRHGDFDVAEFTRLRAEVAAVNASTYLKSASAPSLQTDDAGRSTLPPGSLPALTVVRTGLLSPLIKSMPDLDLMAIEPFLKGPIALLTIPELDPPTLKSLIRAITAASTRPNARATAAGIAQAIGKGKAAQTPAAKIEKPARLPVVTSLVSQRTSSLHDLNELAALPDLRTLQAQLIGLLSYSGQALIQVLQQAAGGNVALTLRGYEQGLQDASKASRATAP
ncbi:uncharacterized protein L969DRAFT_183953 [Mixia osmundae IAM 14324]|uniref:Uncharacterized protein n=1 Tax=Mixia osmundae (strain CBS 9802 / IAM 14324 / JCM 22182 / KY 12970) TaxID=764103 RepID=G7DT96_MIXOS|nr:uncharacterized protein L969DRAFT_183953 [Mixia osmundae IAM 14324]KEI42919.1 hypothetical protein L969DRAFT_183953 [Mixia osmundae IAM 14324]GAA93743.1 hypothetical protein E5Q_00389 [Mixia osmundae IAM 14324]